MNPVALILGIVLLAYSCLSLWFYYHALKEERGLLSARNHLHLLSTCFAIPVTVLAAVFIVGLAEVSDKPTERPRPQVDTPEQCGCIEMAEHMHEQRKENPPE